MIKIKKMRKLLREPKNFFIDMFKKRCPQKVNIRFFQKNKKYGYSKYTIVSACYNVEKYLDAYFNSLVYQTLNFTNNIKIIMIDDGSTDRTASIIKKWINKYPNNIKYFYKENGGQASARNVGLKYVETEWVTFVDPDDFLDIKCFYMIDNFLAENAKKSFCMISMNILFYIEQGKIIKDNHALNFKFKNDVLIKNVDKLEKNIQLSASSAIFKYQLIHEKKLFFSENVKPNFEDAHFIGVYLSYFHDEYVGFLKKSLYFYRKRDDHNSTLDTAWTDPRKYYDVIKYGKLDLLTRYEDNSIPSYIQYAVIYDIIWYVKYLVNNPERISFLSDKKKKAFLELIRTCFSYIETKNILNCNFAGCWFYHKVGMLYCFKKETVPFQICYIDRYDEKKDEILIYYFTGKVDFEDFCVNDTELFPSHAKIQRHDFCGELFLLQRYVWIPFNKMDGYIKIRINNMNSKISLNNKLYDDITLSNIRDILKKTNYNKDNPEDIWLLMDRDIQADDNAEHLYRYILYNYPERKTFFVLKNSSHDWERLKNEGFHLLAYGSPEHEKALRQCSKIISSHIDGYVTNYFRDPSLANKDIVFLQHGIIKDDLSRWLNTKKRIDVLITTTKEEYNSIVEDNTRYKFTSKEVQLAGLPRHDSLLTKCDSQKEIVIMPTWRNALAGKIIQGSSVHELNHNFMNTRYAITWKSFLKNNKLFELSDKHGYKILFFPHANIQPYLKYFELPEYINVKRHCDSRIQEVFFNASILITDFSSVAFDMAFLEKPIIYYQFDEDEVFYGSHTYQKGYFDYRQNGFGPVVLDERSLLYELELILRNDAKPSSVYLDRMKNTFPFKDGNNCERTYRAICSLDQPYPENYINEELLYFYAQKAMDIEKWEIAKRRFDYLYKKTNNKKYTLFYDVNDFRLLVEENFFDEAEKKYFALLEKKISLKLLRIVQVGYALLLFMCGRYQDILFLLKKEDYLDMPFLAAICAEKCGLPLDEATIHSLDEEEKHLVVAYCKHNWEIVFSIADNNKMNNSNKMFLLALLSYAGCQSFDFDREIHYRTKINALYGRNFLWRRLAAHRAYTEKRYKDVRGNIEKLYRKEIKNIPLEFLKMYIESLISLRDQDRFEDVFNIIPEIILRDDIAFFYALDVFQIKDKKKQALDLCEKRIEIGKEVPFYLYAKCLKNVGNIEKAYNTFINNIFPMGEEFLALRAELAEFFENYEDSIACYKKLYALNSERYPISTIRNLRCFINIHKENYYERK